MQPGDVQGLTSYVQAQAPQYGLDPRAVLAVSAQEGMGGGIGDNGTSFGPWQLHQGGAYPSSAPQSPANAANRWAWSPQGIDYALGRMSGVAAGLRGPAAVRAIVYGFERPADPAAEYQAALNAYQQPGAIRGSGRAGGSGGGGSSSGGGGGGGGIIGGIEGTTRFLGELTSTAFWLRALEIVGGGVLLLLGLYLVARQAGLAPKASSVAKAAASATPAGRALAAAGGRT